MTVDTEDNERTADTSDLATRHEGLFLKAALAQRKPDGPAACGHCLNCDEALSPGVRWCDDDCRDDWTRRESQAGAHE